MDYPWYMEPSNMVIVIFFLYNTGFGICSVMFHKLYTDHKLEKGIDPKMSKTETVGWLFLSIVWPIMGLYVIYILIKSIFNGE